MSRDARVEQKLASIALRHVGEAHVDDALNHYAKSAQAAIAAGRMTEKQFDCLPWEAHDQAIAQIAKDNPSIKRPPDAKPAPLPTIDHSRGRGDYTAAINEAKKKAAGANGKK